MKPDYGYKLLREGYNPKCSLCFHEFLMSYLGILGGGQFTTSAELSVDGILYAVSFDFDAEILAEIVKRAPPHIGKLLFQKAADPTPRTVDLPEAISFGMCARLGEPQRGAKETFVPLVIQELL